MDAVERIALRRLETGPQPYDAVGQLIIDELDCTIQQGCEMLEQLIQEGKLCELQHRVIGSLGCRSILFHPKMELSWVGPVRPMGM